MKIEILTAAQLALIPQVRDEWVKVSLDTTPIDRTKVLEILGCLYPVANRPAPKHVIFLNSPVQITLAIAKLGDPTHLQSDDYFGQDPAGVISCNIGGGVHQEVSSKMLQQMPDRFCRQFNFEYTRIARHLDLEIAEKVGDQIRAQSGFMAWPFGINYRQLGHSISCLDFMGRLGFDVSMLTPTFDLAKACGWAVLFGDWAFISAKPESVHLDNQGQLHSETGAAIRYPDGFSVFAIHGVRVSEKIAVLPASITITEIEAERNAEVRRVMIGRYGSERYLMDTGAKEIHRDDFGILFRKEIIGDEALVMVQVVNSTPEPDGRFKDYFLRVPPTMERARQAVAWTFGKEENEYSPALQT